jgi:ABC-type sugar transport system substrate-binding protein
MRARSRTVESVLVLASAGWLVSSCAGPAPEGAGAERIGVAFETLQTEFWVAAMDAIRDELARRDMVMLEAIADGDANRQLEQVRGFIARGVDGIIVVPKDGKSVIPMIRAANEADIPIVLFNRPPDPSSARSVAVVADNLGIARATAEYLCEVARQTGTRQKAAILVGDLGDQNSVQRRDGFDAAMAACEDAVEVVSRIPTEWNQEKALAGVTNALQAHPDLGLIFTSSDFMLPSIVSALRSAGKYHAAGEEGHVILGGFDGDATAWRMLVDGHLDATGVQDVFFESEAAVKALAHLEGGGEVPAVVLDEGFVIHAGNREEVEDRMWGARLARPAAGGGE